MPAVYMLSKGRVKLPKEVRQRLNLKEGDRLAFFYSEPREWYWLVAQNKKAKDLRPLNLPTSETVEEQDALLRFHRDRSSVSKEDMDLVIQVLQRDRDKIARAELAASERSKRELAANGSTQEGFVTSEQGRSGESESTASGRERMDETGEVT